MLPLTSFTLLLNGLTLALSLSFLLITLWQDTRKELSQFFAIFLFMVTLWNGGSMLFQASSFVDRTPALNSIAIGVMEFGFAGSSAAIYVLTAIIIGTHTRKFRIVSFTCLLVILTYQLILIVTNSPARAGNPVTRIFEYQLQPLSGLFYLIFDSTAFYLAWKHRRKIRSRTLLLGILGFVSGQTFSLLNPELQTLTISINISSISALIISFAILRQEIITPLAERIRQIEAMHQVSLAITSHISLNTVLNEIASQAVGWLDADGSGIFLNRGSDLELATVFNLPKQFVSIRIPIGKGMTGSVAHSRQSIAVENYRRDWKGDTDLPLARETFGSTVCVPLIYGGNAIGVLLVIASQQGRLFNRDDVYLLELLGSQAAVAIAHSQLFADQQALTHEVDTAKSQLETVLTSTQSPVIAINRNFQFIFTNPAAKELFSSTTNQIPKYMLPPDYRQTIKELKQKRTYTYEVTHNSTTYQCHIACLGHPRTEGWVAVLNDITQLKELDRLKSEMVRMTSHDLKNPLQAAMANLDLLSDDLENTQNTETKTSLAAINKQLERMNRIISGILDLERVKSGIPTAEVCRADKTIENTINELRDLADEKNITITSQIEENLPNFLGNNEHFERALINLVENAIKFTPASPSSRVIIKAYKTDNEIIFEVQDNGIGIPKTLHNQIFERFFRGRQKGADHISGSGLGLSLAKTIIENHNGRIWLTSQEGKGTTFYIAIPALSSERLSP
jgi:signal transduction histidine kinase